MIPSDSILRKVSARLRTSSAVVPALLASVIAMPIGAAGLILGSEATQTLFAICLLSPLAIALSQIFFFTFFDRDRLHNEEHLERRMLIGLDKPQIGDRSGVTIIEAEGLPVRNPSITGSSDV
jgi:hypothetical protein